MKFLHQNLQVKSTKLYSILYIQTGRMRIEFFYSLPRCLQSHLESKDNTPQDMHRKLDAYCGKKNTKANLFIQRGQRYLKMVCKACILKKKDIWMHTVEEKRLAKRHGSMFYSSHMEDLHMKWSRNQCLIQMIVVACNTQH